MKKTKKIISAVSVIFILFSLIQLPCFSSNDLIRVYLNDEEIEFDVLPVIINDRTMVPLRAIFEALGADVKWHDETKTASCAKDGRFLSISIGSYYMNTDAGYVELDSPAIIIDDRTLVPVRAISESFGCDVDWDQETRSVIITTENYIDKSELLPYQETVYIDNTRELLENISSNKKLILTKETYDLTGSFDIDNKYITNQSYSDGYKITKVLNLSIEGNAEITIEDKYADVLSFENCYGITLSGLSVGHKEGFEEYQCEGAVINLFGCEDVNINNCSLYGCGAFGVYSDSSKNISINNTKIYDCSYTGIWLTMSQAKVSKTEFFDSKHESGFIRVDNSDITIEESYIHNIDCSADGRLIDNFDYDRESSVIINNSKFADNIFEIAAAPDLDITITGCEFENNSADIHNTNT